MENNFQKALSFTLEFEGGFSDDPKDSGGATMHGITQRVYDAYREDKGDVLQSVKLISDPEVSDIYFHEYWLANHCDVLPDKIDIAVFDFAVNAGGESMRELQYASGVKVDGIFGAKTQAAVINGALTNDLLNRFLNAHEDFYKNLCKKFPKDIHFLNGWINRSEKMRALLS